MKAKKVSKNKKRFLALSMAMVAAFSLGALAACGDDSESSSPSGPSSPVATTYTVTYNVNGNAASTETVSEGSKATKPADPVQAGQTFVGWYKDSAFKNLYNFNDVVKGNLTLYARFATPAANEFKATFYVDGVALNEQVETVGGVFYEGTLPTPTKEGATFAGWWTSDYGDPAKLTEKCVDLAVEEPTTLYAVWESEAPLVSVNENGVSWTMSKAGQVTVTIKKEGVEEAVETKTLTGTNFAFNFNEKEGGDYVIEVAVGGETGTAYFNNKALAKVSVFSYEGTTLTWAPVQNATKYKVSVVCGDVNHTHVDEEVEGTSYDFSNCAMKFDGITFVVKATAEGYAESVSEPFTVVKNLNAATNITFDATTATFTWDAVENATSYKVVVNGQTYNVTENKFDAKEFGVGALEIAVTPVAFGFNSPASATAMAAKNNLATPKNIALGGSVLTWDAVASATGYVVTIDGTDYEVATNAFDLSTLTFEESATACTVVVKAIGATEATNSLESALKTVGFGVMADTLTYNAGKVAWDPVLKVQKFEVRVNEGEATEYNADALTADVVFTKAGANVIEVRCYNLAGVASDWVNLEVEAFEVRYDYGVGINNSTPSVFKAVGDTYTIPTEDPATPGYQFKGWFNAASNGVEYESKTAKLETAANCVVYATWTANTYTISYTYNGVVLNQTVTYDQPYSIPVPQSSSDDAYFGGWWSEVNGQGVQYTDNMGQSVGVWKFTENQTAVACEIELYEYVAVTSVTTGKPGWSVKAGADIGKVTEIKIPASYNGLPVIGIEQMGFASCGHLVKISIPDTMETIFLGLDGPHYGTGSALYKCSLLEEVEVYEVEGNHQKFYKDIDGALVRMTEYNGNELVFVPYAWTLDEYRIPDEIDTITTNLFRNYKGLKKIIIPNTVTKIDAGAFNTCKMDELIFEEGGDQPLIIGANAFRSCGVTELTLPARMGEFEGTLSQMFLVCHSLENIIVEAGNQFYSSKEGFLYNKDGDTLLYAPRGKTGEIRIPNGTVKIGEAAFVDLSSGVIDACERITKVIIPVGVEEIGKNAFKNCTGLNSVEFLGGANDAKLNIGESAFYNTSLGSLTLPANTGLVGAHAFGGIRMLGQVNVEAGEGFEVEVGAFGDTSNNYYVATIYLGKNVHVFDVNGAFGPTKLNTIVIHEENTHLKLVDGVLFDSAVTQIVYYPASKTGNYTIPNTIEVIGGNVFNGKSLEEVEIPFTVKEIGGAAFANCVRLTKVTFLPSDNAEAVHEGLTLGAEAFKNCTSLVDFTLPAYVTEIGASAFESCTALTGEFVVPEGVTKVGDAAFRDASGITSISLPASMTELGRGKDGTSASYPEYYRSFIGCDSLAEIKVAANNPNYKTVDGILYVHVNGVPTELITCPSGYAVNEGKAEIPGTVRKIWAYAFYKNVALKEVSFADVVLAEGETAASVTIEMGKSVFEEAKGLQRAKLGTGVTSISQYMFKNASALEYLFIPNTVATIEYSSPLTGCYALETIEFEEGNESNALVVKGSSGPDNAYTGSSAFYKLTALTEIRFPKRTKEIGNMAFVDCTNLEYMFVPNTVTKFGNWMFGYGNNTKYMTGCPNLREVEFEEGNDEVGITIGKRSFEGTPLTNVELPARTTEIMEYAFAGSKITSITIPEKVTKIGNYAFQYCENLDDIVFEGTSTITSIGDYAFASCKITEFEVPATVETIGKYAFAYTTKMQDFTFAEGSALKEVKDYAFRQTGASRIAFPESTNNIKLGTDLFQYCTNLEEVYVSATVTTIGDTFGHCGSLKRVIVSADNANFKVEGSGLYNKDGTAIQYLFEAAPVDGEGVYRIANGVTEIGVAAFRGQIDIKKLIVPASVTKINASAFAYCVNLEEIEFDLANSQLTELGASAFEGCTALKSVELPVSTKTLGSKAFYGCTSLASAKITGVATLGGSTFYNCTSLKNINLDSVTKSGTYDFAYTGLTSVTIPVTLTTIGNYMFYYAQDLESVTIPEGAKAIGGYMFRGCKSLKELNVPASVATIGTYAFADSGLESFEFTNPATTLNTYLFYGCTDLKTVKMVEGMTTLFTGMFYNCTSLGADLDNKTSAIVLPNSLTTVHGSVFYGCTSMKMIEFPANIAEFGTSSRWSTSTTSSLFYGCTSLEKVVLPAMLERMGGQAFINCTNLKTVENLNNLQFVGASAFRNTGLESITLPSVTTVNGYAFAENAFLTDVNLNDSLAGIQYNAFMGCTALEEIQLPSMLTLLGSNSTTGNGNVFQGCVSLKKITLPAGISEVRKYMFEGCTSLEEVVFEGQAVIIGQYAFANCPALKSFPWSDYLTTIEANAFAGSGIERVELAAATSSVDATSFLGCSVEEFVVNPLNVYYKIENDMLINCYTNEMMMVLPSFAPENGKLVIDDTFNWNILENGYPFAGNTTITEIEIKASAGWTEIPVNLFYGMMNLEKVTLPEGIEAINTYAFEACPKLAQINIPSTVTYIGAYAFYNNESLTEITIPEGVETIDEYAFCGTKLTSIVIPASVKTIERYAFYGIEELATITFNEGLETVGGQAFAGTGITEVTVPASVKTFGSSVSISDNSGSTSTISTSKVRSFVFAECKNLVEATFLGSAIELTGSTFKNCTSLTTVNLPEGLKMIEDYMFYGCISLKNVEIPETVETIGGYAFAYSGIESITIPELVECVGQKTLMTDPYQTGSTTGQTNGAYYELAYPNGHVFMGCESLTEVIFEGNVKQIGWYAFEGCTSLESITLPDSVEIIGDFSFANCTALTSLNIPTSTMFIGNNAFENTAITSVVIPSTAVVYNNAFKGWTAAQTINAELSAYKAWSIWNLTWNAGTNATIVWGYNA